MSSDPVDFSDPLVVVAGELEAIREKLAGDAANREIEFARFRRETLERLNAMCDRTIETARAGEENVKARIAKDREEIDARVDAWRERLALRIGDEAFLDSLAADAVSMLLPSSFLSSLSSNGGERS
ncbi:MAG: hypothetical protein LBQ90_02275 [Synergistaceae bacterium]|jgi:hypothetical protein|nr:hypothetical protein [Synergistaceae bacterium]